MSAQASFAFASLEPETPAPALEAELRRPCRECPLGVLSPGNAGLIASGPVTAKIAVLTDHPAPFEAKSAGPLYMVGGEWAKWLGRLGLTPQGVFVTHVVQCPQPPGNFTEVSDFFRAYDENITHCLQRKALRLLRSMGQLEVVILLGLPVAKILLGGEPRERSHLGEWFGSVHLPGVAVFCLEHPRVLEPGVNEKRGRIYEVLKGFQNLYLRGGSMPALAQLAYEAWKDGGMVELNRCPNAV